MKNNLMMSIKNYKNAIYYYKRAISLISLGKNTSESIIDNKEKEKDKLFQIKLYYNLSEAYFKYGYKTKAIENSDIIINFSVENLEKLQDKQEKEKFSNFFIKGLLIKIKDLVGLRKYKQAFNTLFNNQELIFKKEIDDLLKIKEVSNFNFKN